MSLDGSSSLNQLLKLTHQKHEFTENRRVCKCKIAVQTRLSIVQKQFHFPVQIWKVAVQQICLRLANRADECPASEKTLQERLQIAINQYMPDFNGCDGDF